MSPLSSSCTGVAGFLGLNSRESSRKHLQFGARSRDKGQIAPYSMHSPPLAFKSRRFKMQPPKPGHAAGVRYTYAARLPHSTGPVHGELRVSRIALIVIL